MASSDLGSWSWPKCHESRSCVTTAGNEPGSHTWSRGPALATSSETIAGEPVTIGHDIDIPLCAGGPRPAVLRGRALRCSPGYRHDGGRAPQVKPEPPRRAGNPYHDLVA